MAARVLGEEGFRGEADERLFIGRRGRVPWALVGSNGPYLSVSLIWVLVARVAQTKTIFFFELLLLSPRLPRYSPNKKNVSFKQKGKTLKKLKGKNSL